MVFQTLTISGEPTEFGVLAISAVEVLIVVAYLLRGRAEHSLEANKIFKALYVVIGAGFFSLALGRFPTVGWFQMIHILSATFFFSLILDKRTNIKKVVFIFCFVYVRAAAYM